MKAWQWLAIVVLSLSPMFARGAEAQSSLTTLGVRSLDGDAALELQVSRSLNKAVLGLDEFQVREGNVSLAQMTLAHGCENANESCLADIANTLESDYLLFGTLTRSGASVKLSLYRFSAAEGSLDGRISKTVPGARLKEPQADATVEKLVRRMVHADTFGAVELTSEPGAQVELDGEPVGTVDENGFLAIESVPVGPHTLTVASEGGDARRSTPVEVAGGATQRMSLPLERVTEPAAPEQPMAAEVPQASESVDKSVAVRRGFGFGLIGLAALSAGATGYSWLRIQQIAEDSTLKEYRLKFARPDQPGGRTNVCEDAKRGTLAERDPSLASLEQKAKSLCTEATTLETLQYVFIGGTIVTATIGMVLLLKKPKPKRKIAFAPQFHRRGALLGASLRF